MFQELGKYVKRADDEQLTPGQIVADKIFNRISDTLQSSAEQMTFSLFVVHLVAIAEKQFVMDVNGHERIKDDELTEKIKATDGFILLNNNMIITDKTILEYYNEAKLELSIEHGHTTDPQK